MTRRRSSVSALSPWPGYVDALSTLLMVIIFVLLVFVLAQAFLSEALNGRDQALDRLGRKVAELADMLSIERGKTAELSATVAQLTQDLQATEAARQAAAAQLPVLREALARAGDARAAAETRATEADRKAGDLGLRLTASQARIGTLSGELADIEQKVDEREAAAVAKLADQIRALLALRDQLRGQVQTQGRVSAAAQAQVALLSRQVDALRQQLGQLAAALDVSKKDVAARDVKIADLGAKLNAALVTKVAELQKYRSEFFGRLRDVLAGKPGIAVAGDRFVFQSEVLFPAGSAELTRAGVEQIRTLAATLKGIAKDIPPDLGWVLRVDGHADRQAVHGRFTSNWELSAARAITVVKLLIAEGVAPAHLAAAGFGEFQPVAAGDTPAAYARNRRIELRLTDR